MFGGAADKRRVRRVAKTNSEMFVSMGARVTFINQSPVPCLPAPPHTHTHNKNIKNKCGADGASAKKSRRKMTFIPCFYNPLNNFPMLADILTPTRARSLFNI
jgi:hypothetical protein